MIKKDDMEKNIKQIFLDNINNKEGLSKALDKYLIPDENDKKMNAEISTPYELRQKMLDKIPLEFWTKKQKVFEPCSGKGGFLIDILNRFMDGLKDNIPDKEERYKVIVEECLYFSDINPLNIYINKLLLDPNSKYTLNYNEGDTLILDIKEKWGFSFFDAIVGNPPYQKASINGKAVGGKGLWIQFIKKNLNILKNNGYFCNVNPCGWRRVNDDTGKILKKHEFLFLKTRTKPFKNIGVYVDWYVICKNNKGQYNNIPFIPNDNRDVSINIIKKILNCKNKFDVKILSKYGSNSKLTNRIKNEEYKYSIYHTNTQVIYSKEKPEYYNKSKIIVSDSGEFKPIYDEGNYGTSQDSMYHIVNDKEEADKKLLFLNNNLSKWFLKVNMVGNFRNDWKLISFIPLEKIKLTEEEEKIINF